jgi:membrane protein YqaA with SNARE-associated domain
LVLTQDLKARRIGVALLFLALVWSFAEATIFFVVPDVIISLIALIYGWRAGGLAVVAAILGAVLGGVVGYHWGQANFSSATAFFDKLPAISGSTFKKAQAGMAEANFGFMMVMGSMTSVPYKVYAAEAGDAGLPLWAFLLTTPLARFPRFALAVLVSQLAATRAPAVLLEHKIKLWALFWLAFYALYWSLAPS